ncbi:MAG: hypothetical protein GX590_10610, partial [Lentisphaerae bacterium]|nr:hypothetical protein [Lentisphaerota bacterium]
MNTFLQAGFAEIDLTPDGPVRLAGQFAERVSESVESPVTATALALEANGEQAVICSCDLVSVSTELLAAIRARLGGEPGLDPDRVVVCATHTHTSLVYQDAGLSRSLAVLQRYLPPNKQYIEHVHDDDVLSAPAAFDWLVRRIAEAIATAWRAREPSRVANGFGRAAVGMNRRAVYSDGSAAMWGDTNTPAFEHLEGGNDSGVELLYVFSEAGARLRGVVANVACPAQCVQHRTFLSSDYWGDVKRELRAQLGDELAVVGLCSAAGDQCPVDLIRWVEPDHPLDDPNIVRIHPLRRRADPSMFDIAGKRKAGHRIAQAILEELGDASRSPVEPQPFTH